MGVFDLIRMRMCLVVDDIDCITGGQLTSHGVDNLGRCLVVDDLDWILRRRACRASGGN